MAHKIEIYTCIKNGCKTIESYLDNETMALYRISRLLTKTTCEDDNGVFSLNDKPVNISMSTLSENHIFTFEPMPNFDKEMICKRIKTVKEYFTRKDVEFTFSMETED